MKTGIAALVGVAGLAASALGTGTVTLSISVTTDNGDAIIDPSLGEACAYLTVSATMVDDAGGNPLFAYGGAVNNVLGDANAAGGSITFWSVLNGLADIDPPGDTTTTDGTSLFNVSTLQLGFSPRLTTANPIDLLTFTWCATDFSARTVCYTTDLTPSLGLVGVLTKNSKNKIVSETWAGFDGSACFDVVPAPASLALLGLGGLAAGRRRR